MPYRLDLYLAAIVTAMFLAGCVVFILRRREQSQARKRWNSELGRSRATGDLIAAQPDWAKRSATLAPRAEPFPLRNSGCAVLTSFRAPLCVETRVEECHSICRRSYLVRRSQAPISMCINSR